MWHKKQNIMAFTPCSASAKPTNMHSWAKINTPHLNILHSLIHELKQDEPKLPVLMFTFVFSIIFLLTFSLFSKWKDFNSQWNKVAFVWNDMTVGLNDLTWNKLSAICIVRKKFDGHCWVLLTTKWCCILHDCGNKMFFFENQVKMKWVKSRV